MEIIFNTYVKYNNIFKLFFYKIFLVLNKLKYIIKSLRIKKTHKSKTYLLDSCPQKKVQCLKVTFMSPKKPNSASRKIAKVSFSKGKRDAFCYIPGIKHNLQKFSTVLLRGGRTKDLPGFKYKLVRGVFDLKSVQNRFKARSKYGIKQLLNNVKGN